MNIIQRAWLWLITKEEKESDVSEPLNDTVVATPATSTVETTKVTPAVVTDSVQDFEKALQFVRDGVVTLGQSAESELIALAKKYL